MKYNNGKEKLSFEQDWAQKRKLYLDMGMSDEAIDELYKFDLKFFNSTRRFKEHNIYLEDVPESELVDDSNKTKCYESYYWWINEINNPLTEKLLSMLTEKEIKIIHLYYHKKFTQAEIGRKLGESQKAVSKCINKIKKLAMELEEKEK